MIRKKVSARTPLIIISILLLIGLVGLPILISQLNDLRRQVSELQANARHPTLSVWNSCNGPCIIGAESFRAGGVPDTFTTHLAFTSDVPVLWAFLTLDQFVTFKTFGGVCSVLRGPQPEGLSRTSNCLILILHPEPFVTGQSIYVTGLDGAGTSVEVDFHLAEGCGSYVLVLAPDLPQAAHIVPDMSTTYQPADRPTGACSIGTP